MFSRVQAEIREVGVAAEKRLAFAEATQTAALQTLYKRRCAVALAGAARSGKLREGGGSLGWVPPAETSVARPAAASASHGAVHVLCLSVP